MLGNFLVVFFRILGRGFTSSLIRLSGLSIGIAVFGLSLLYLLHEYSFDNFHYRANQIYRLGRITDRGKVASTAFPLVPALRVDFPQHEFTQFFKDRSRTLFKKDEKAFYEDGMIWADAHFLQIFSFKDFVGNPQTALAAPYSVVMTQEAAEKYFGKDPVLGQTVEFKWNEEFRPLNLTGIIPEWPENMHISFDILISFESTKTSFPPGILDNWDMNHCYSYARLEDGAQPGQLQERFDDFAGKHVSLGERKAESFLGFLQPIQSVHRDPDVLASYTNTVQPNYPKIALAIGGLVLLITAINFITLTVAQFHQRSREVGVRKAMGATRRQVIAQLVFETGLLVACSFLTGLGLLYLTADFFNELMSTGIGLDLIPVYWLVAGGIVFTIGLTLLTGLYPAVFYSKDNIAGTLRTQPLRSGSALRKALLVAQYSISATLITLGMIVYSQLEYVSNKELGYTKEQVLYIPHGRRIRDNPEPFKTKALQHPAIERVSLSFYKPTDAVTNMIDLKVEGKEPIKIAATSVDEDFFESLGIGLTEGMNFSPDGQDLDRVFILNESAVRLLELSVPLGAILETRFSTGEPTRPIEERTGQVIGVVKDVHFESLHHAIKPMVFMVKPYWYFYINVKVNGDLKGALGHLEATWKEMFPELPFEYSYLDEDFENLYQNDTRAANGFLALAVLALVTTCVGLFGFVRFLVQQRTREVGIRKVLGAAGYDISSLFVREYLQSLAMAALLSLPAAYFVSNWWLENYHYREPLSAIPFGITLLMLLAVSIATVAGELVRAMRINPSETLRSN